jgi:site-specific DNA-methyltransferase (adenine-specific)
MIKTVKLSTLKPHPSNSDIYQTTDIEDLAINIGRVGLLNRIVVNKNNTIISGHRRLRALKVLGIQEAEVEISNVSPEEELLHLISHNQYRTKTTSEIIKEIELLHKLYYVGQGKRNDLTSGNVSRGSTRDMIGEKIGLSGRQVSKLLFIKDYGSEFLPALDAGKITIASAYNKALHIKKRQEVNDSIQLDQFSGSDYTIHNKSSANMAEVASGSVNLIFTSPPYFGVERKNITQGIGSGEPLEAYITNLKEVFTECYRVLSEEGSIYVVVAEGGTQSSFQGSCERILLSLIDIGFHYRSRIIWNKVNPQPKSIQKRYMPSYEIVYFLTKGKNYTFNYVDGYDIDKIDTTISKRYASGIHGTTFPESLVKVPLLKSSSPEDIVLDPFCGSGTTGKVCLDYGRKFIGYDIDETYCKLSVKRLSEHIKSNTPKLSG